MQPNTRSRWILCLFGLSAIALLPWATQVKVDTALEHLMIAGDPERIRNLEVKDRFSNDEILVVAFDLGHPFQGDDLRRLNSFSIAVSEIPGVEEVIDLSTVEDIRSQPDEGAALDGSPLVTLETIDEDLSAIRERVRDHPLYRDSLVSSDGEVLALAIVLDLTENQSFTNAHVTESLLQLLDDRELPGVPYISGYPFSEHDASRLLQRDLAVLSAAALVLIGVLIALVTGSLRMSALTIGNGLWAQIVCGAWFGVTETPYTIVTAIVPTVLLAISSTHGIYVAGLLAQVKSDEVPADRIADWIRRPTLIATASTVVGFLSLRFMPVTALGQLGTGLAVGVVAAAAGALFALPAAIRVLDLRLAGRDKGQESFRSWIFTGLRWARHPEIVLAALLLVIAGAGLGVLRLRIDSDPLTYWPQNSYHRQSADFVRTRLSGTLPINVLIRTGKPGAALDPEVLAFANLVSKELEEREEVDRTLSFLDYLELMDAAVQDVPVGRRVLPSRSLAAQYLLLYESGGDPDDYRHYIDWERQSLNIFVRVNDRSSSVALRLRERVLSMAESAPKGVEVSVLGTWLLFPKAMDAITRGMIGGLAAALAGVFLVMFVALRSLRLAAISLVPTTLPIIAFTGLMGWLGMPLSMGTAIVGSVALGLAVDDTAHVLGHLRAGNSVVHVYRRVGPALALTTVLLALCFGVLAFSNFLPVAHLGIATAATLVIAFGCNWLVLPSLLALMGWDVSLETPPQHLRPTNRAAPLQTAPEGR